MKRCLRRFSFLVASLVAGTGGASTASAGEAETVTFRGAIFEVYRADPNEVRLHWKDSTTDKPYRMLRTLQEALAKKGHQIEFVTNAGIFEPGGVPSGIHVEQGRELRPLNLKDGSGNFYLKPNGVFFITTEGKAGVLESAAYAQAQPKARLALQSGPLLLQDDRIHPAFRAASTSKLHRNGVGIDADGRVLFAMTKWGEPNRVNLHSFAEFFREMGCRDALFLDGDISAMAVNPVGALPPGNHFGAILTVIRKENTDTESP